MTTESHRLALLICSPGPDRPDLCVTPLIHAMAACALDCEVEVHFAGPAIRLLVDGVATHLYPTPDREKSILAFLQEATAAGATLLACSMARATWVTADERLIPDCEGSVGATVFVARVLDPHWKTLVF